MVMLDGGPESDVAVRLLLRQDLDQYYAYLIFKTRFTGFFVCGVAVFSSILFNSVFSCMTDGRSILQI